MKFSALLLIFLCAQQGGCIALDSTTPSVSKSPDLKIRLTVNNVTTLRTIDSSSLWMLIQKIKYENQHDNQFYYVTVHRPALNKMYKFYLSGAKAAETAELKDFILYDSDGVYFGRILP